MPTVARCPRRPSSAHRSRRSPARTRYSTTRWLASAPVMSCGEHPAARDHLPDRLRACLGRRPAERLRAGTLRRIVFYTAYLSEIFRTAISGVHSGQQEAGVRVSAGPEAEGEEVAEGPHSFVVSQSSSTSVASTGQGRPAIGTKTIELVALGTLLVNVPPRIDKPGYLILEGMTPGGRCSKRR